MANAFRNALRRPDFAGRMIEECDGAEAQVEKTLIAQS
jgi:hypothetical protein